MKKVLTLTGICFLVILVFVSKTYSTEYAGIGMDAEGVAATNAMAVAVSTAIEQTAAMDEARYAEDKMMEMEKKEEELQKWIKSNAVFIAKSYEVKKTISILIKMSCLLDEIFTLQKQRRNKAFNSNYESFEYDINTVRVTAQIQELTTLLSESMNTSGLDKASKFEKITNEIYLLYQDLSAYRNLLSYQVYCFNRSESKKTENKVLIDKRSRYYFSKNKLISK